MRFGLLMLLALPLAAASDVSGKWTIDGDIQGNAVNLNCTLKQNADAKVTGKCTVNGTDEVDIAGEVKDEKIKFSFTAGGYTLDYTGALTADTMKGDIDVAGASGTFTGKRIPE